MMPRPLFGTQSRFDSSPVGTTHDFAAPVEAVRLKAGDRPLVLDSRQSSP